MPFIIDADLKDALQTSSPILAVCTQQNSAERLETWSQLCVAAGRKPVVLAGGDWGWRYGSVPLVSKDHRRSLAAGTVLDVQGLIDWWNDCWWKPQIMGERSSSLNQNLVLLGEALAHQMVLRRQRLGLEFNIASLRDLLPIADLFEIFNPDLSAPEDPFLVRARAATARYAHNLDPSVSLQPARMQDLSETILDTHGYNQVRLRLSQWIEGSNDLFTSSWKNPGWDAAGWMDRGDVVLIGGQHGMFDDPTYQDNNTSLFRWITSDLKRGLTKDASSGMPDSLLFLDDDPTRQVPLDGWSRWIERDALNRTLDDMALVGSASRKRTRL